MAEESPLVINRPTRRWSSIGGLEYLARTAFIWKRPVLSVVTFTLADFLTAIKLEPGAPLIGCMTAQLSFAERSMTLRAAPLHFCIAELNGWQRLIGSEFSDRQPRIRRLYQEASRSSARPENASGRTPSARSSSMYRPDRDQGAIPASRAGGRHRQITPSACSTASYSARLVAQARADFQVMTRRVLHQAPEGAARILPVDFSGTDAATEQL